MKLRVFLLLLLLTLIAAAGLGNAWLAGLVVSAGFMACLYGILMPDPIKPRDYPRERCDVCVFYRAPVNGEFPGKCRRNPPSDTGHPYVHAGSWCGEFQPIPPACVHSWRQPGMGAHHHECVKCGAVE